MSDFLDDSPNDRSANRSADPFADLTADSLGKRLRRWTHQQPLTFFLGALVTGILVDHYVGPAAVALWSVLGFICCVVFFKIDHQSTERSRRKRLFVALVAVASIGGINHRYQDFGYQSAQILQHVTPNSQPAIVEGVIVSTPRLRSHPLIQQQILRGESPWQTVLEVEISRFRIGESMQPMSGRLRVTVNGQSDNRNPGDVVRLLGDLHSARVPSNPGAQSSRRSDRRNEIHARMEIDRVQQLELIEASESVFNLHRPIARIATSARKILLDQIGPSNGPLAVALVTGQRDFVDNQTSDLLLVTGTAHLLSVSGMHLAIVVALATYICLVLRMPMGLRVTTIIVVCVFYTAITGGRPPVLRAAILVGALLLAILIRRPSHPLNTLSLAGLILLAYNPENAFAIGVQLSFLAVATLLIASGRIGHSTGSLIDQQTLQVEDQFDAMYRTTRSKLFLWIVFTGKWIKTLIWLSVCVTFISMPLVWYAFHVVSPISVLTNVVLGPFLFAALGFGIATVIGGMIHPVFGWVPAKLCGITIYLMRQIIEVASGVPYGHFWLPSPSVGWVIAFYVVLCCLMLMRQSKRVRLFRFLWIIGWILTTLLVTTRSTDLPESSLEATFVDVGHGTCVIIRSRSEVWIYDCGRLGNEQGSSRDIDRALWSLGVTRINGLMLSHADSDHFNALPGLLRRFRIDQIVTPPGMLDEPEPAVLKIRDLILAAKIPVVQTHAGQRLAIGGTIVKVLHPPAIRLKGSDNANSLVVRLDHAGRSLLLPGDLEPPGTEVLLTGERPPPGGILMAPHHGSLSMNADAILHWGRPSQTVVSGGRLARNPEVTKMLNQFGSQVHVTALSGAVRVRILASGEIQIQRWHDSPW